MNRDVAQLVSAPALGAGGPPFESEYPDITKTSLNFSEVFCFIPYPYFVNRLFLVLEQFLTRYREN